MYPRLRADLPISPQQTAEGNVYVLKDPASGRFFRLREHEYFVARQLDGLTDLESIRRRAQEQLGAPIDSDTLSSFVRQLDSLRLLETATVNPHRAVPTRPWRGNLLHLRFKTFDPDRLLTRAVRPLRFFFTPAFIALSAVTIVFAIGIVATSWSEIWLHLRRLYRVDTFVIGWLSILVVTVLHEFAHGLTCKYFGGQVREMGLMLLYFQPAMYCNVSDAWLFPRKSRRLWVTFAGGYFEAFLWSLATITWRTTDADALVNVIALVVMVTSGVKIAFNANPLIKLDGYYLLSDYLAIPNLRQRSFTHLRGWWKHVVRRDSPAPEVTTRERRVYMTYGLLAGLYSTWLLGWVSWHVGGYLLERYRAVGLLVFVSLLILVFQRVITAWVITPIRAALRIAAWRPTKFRALRWSAYSLGSAVLVLTTFAVPVELRVVGDFTILPVHNADVRAEVEGFITQILVDEGDRVSTGRVLARLSTLDQSTQLATIEGAIQEKQARLKLLIAGPRQEEIALALSEVATAGTRRAQAEERYAEAVRLQSARISSAERAVTASQERLTYTQNDLERFSRLFDGGLVSRTELESRQQQVRLLQNELERARDELTVAEGGDAAQLRQEVAVFAREAAEADGRVKVLMAGSRREEIEATQAEITQLLARRAFLVEQVRLATITSPATGIVVTPRLKEKVGQHVSRGDLITEVYELRTVSAEIAVSEKDIADVTVNAPVSLKVRAYPDRTFTGKVAAISPAAVSEGELGATVFRVRVDTDNAGDALKPAMTGTAKIVSHKRSLFTILTRRLARVVRVEFWSWW
jgi:putative peptide zinc metalloprotease protein